MSIDYRLEPDLAAAAFIDILTRSGLGERRPIGEPERMAKVLRNSAIIVTARSEGRLVGVSRALSDFGWACYLSNLAVDRDFQRQGIGRELVRRTHEAAGPETTLLLRAAPAARDYYPKIGMLRIEHAWMFNRAR